MHNLHISPPNRRVRTPFLIGGLLALGLLLSACGVTDEAGTKFRIVMESMTFTGEDESLAPLGILQVGEMASVRFEVTLLDRDPVDRTAQAVFRLVERDADDREEDFIWVESSDPAVTPHTIRSDVEDATISVCATYNGPEVIGPDPMEDCMTVITFVPDA